MTSDSPPSILHPQLTHRTIPDDVIYLNHGSFGPTPRVVQAAREEWSRRLAAQPMDFFLRQMEPALDAALARLAKFVDAAPSDLVFVDNATTAMNAVAASVSLSAGDEILLNDHEYGAVRRIWQRTCQQTGARLVTVKLPTPFTTAGDIVDRLLAGITPKTKLLVASHVTSPTAIVMPMAEICRATKDRGVPVCVDGPHAIAMQPLSLKMLGATYYCASLHKWLSAPLGSGFLYVDKSNQPRMQPPLVSWGRSLGGKPARWQDDWNWIGTRDPAPFLSVPTAIDFLEQHSLAAFRDHGHTLARDARRRLLQLFNTEPLTPDDPAWYGTMVTIPLPPGPTRRTQPNAADPLQAALWQRYRIEIPIVDWNDRRHIRVSCHLYNDRQHLDDLIAALQSLEREGLVR